MTFTIVEDDKDLQVRATISTRDDLVMLIGKLQRRLDDGFFKDEKNDKRNTSTIPASPSTSPSTSP